MQKVLLPVPVSCHALYILLKIFINILGKSSQLVVRFSGLILLDRAVIVAKNKISKTIFYISQRCITPRTQGYQNNCGHDLYSFKQDNTVLMHMVNNRNFAPLHGTLLFPETLLCLTLLPYVYMVHNRNLVP